MAFLAPDKTETINGVVIKTKIIPVTAKMNKDTGRHKKGDPFRDQRKINGTGKATYLTIHNTPAIKQAAGTTMSEQYSRATYPNQAMSTTRVHYYTDAVETWQNLPETDVSWHAGETANLCSISIEIIGDSAKAEDNGARLAAMRLIANKIPIERMVTHNKWMGLPDKVVVGAAKNCPFYILPHWSVFVKKVEGYMKEFSGSQPDPKPPGKVPYTIRLDKGTPYYIQPDNTSKVAGKIEIAGVYTIVEEVGAYGWLKSGAGWVRLADDPAPPAPTPTGHLTAWADRNPIKRGTKGKHVEVLQAILYDKGYDIRQVDGNYGAVTENAVKAYQKDQKLTVDGWAGAQVWVALIGG